MWQDLTIQDFIYFQWIPVTVFNQIMDVDNGKFERKVALWSLELSYLAIIFFKFGHVDAYISDVKIYKIKFTKYCVFSITKKVLKKRELRLLCRHPSQAAKSCAKFDLDLFEA